MQAKERKKIRININPQPPAAASPNPVSLIGGSVLLKIRNPITGLITTVVPTPAADGQSATYWSQA
jgi:hypothetical protein